MSLHVQKDFWPQNPLRKSHLISDCFSKRSQVEHSVWSVWLKSRAVCVGVRWYSVQSGFLCSAAESLRKTGSPNPRWHAELDSVQLGWLMHQVPNTMRLLWWGDVLCSLRFTAGFSLVLPGLSCIQHTGGKNAPECLECRKMCSTSFCRVNTLGLGDIWSIRLSLAWLSRVCVESSQSSCAGQSQLSTHLVVAVCFVCSETRPAAVCEGCCSVWLLGRLSVRAFVWAEWDYVRRPSSSVSGSLLHLERRVGGWDDADWVLCTVRFYTLNRQGKFM